MRLFPILSPPISPGLGLSRSHPSPGRWDGGVDGSRSSRQGSQLGQETSPFALGCSGSGALEGPVPGGAETMRVPKLGWARTSPPPQCTASWSRRPELCTFQLQWWERPFPRHRVTGAGGAKWEPPGQGGSWCFGKRKGPVAWDTRAGFAAHEAIDKPGCPVPAQTWGIQLGGRQELQARLAWRVSSTSLD